eukprot:1700556-Amphidinium_carterae.2
MQSLEYFSNLVIDYHMSSHWKHCSRYFERENGFRTQKADTLQYLQKRKVRLGEPHTPSPGACTW